MGYERGPGPGPEADRLEIPRRYGADVPDVQLILLQELRREFVAWVEEAFKARGLRTEVMFLHPNFPKEAVIQRQIIEGVQAVVELDVRAHTYGKIPLQVFDRSAGMSNVRFDKYQDLDPAIAAEVVVRAKAHSTQVHHPVYPTASAVYQQQPQQQHQAFGVQAAAYPGVFTGQLPSAADIAGIVGQADNATLQRLLASLQAQGGGGGGQQAATAAAAAGVNYGSSSLNAQLDMRTLLGDLGRAGQVAPSYGQQPAQQGYGLPVAASGGLGAGDAAAQVQNIMAQLARIRQ